VRSSWFTWAVVLGALTVVIVGVGVRLVSTSEAAYLERGDRGYRDL
jgi:hypothetical protein